MPTAHLGLIGCFLLTKNDCKLKRRGDNVVLHDRDIDAAKNIRRQGLLKLKAETVDLSPWRRCKLDTWRARNRQSDGRSAPSCVRSVTSDINSQGVSLDMKAWARYSAHRYILNRHDPGEHMNPEAQKLIEKFDLLAHPEGGYYRENYRAPLRVKSQAHHGERAAFTSIYFLLVGSQYSAWHRVSSDESWFFHAGCDLELMTLPSPSVKPTDTLKIQSIGPQSGSFELTVPAGTWFAARPVDPSGFTLVSCVVGPGFEFEDFELATSKQLIEEGCELHPDWNFIIQFLSTSSPRES
ncbi:hypothetical protein DBV39_12000 [Orrella marina]|uniref:DUF985 domain-containing protein n=2 Tax=Orrella marina TaxID=2163011 RepID=A0A2R4XKG5_9BURK|nr:hypothetical protein DBV39_12000 [Orrella marina]